MASKHERRIGVGALAACGALAAAFAGVARAEVTASAADTFTIRHSVVVPLDATAAYARLVRVQDWWDKEHTYSGDAQNLSIAVAPNGCYCERLADGGFIEHMRVIYAQPGKVLRMDGGLGPLQGIAARGVLTYTLKPEGPGTRVTLTYVVTGAAGSLEQLAAAVDMVMGQGLGRFGNVAGPA